MFLGIILGIILTVGAAYIADSVRNTSGPEGSAERPVVNWDIVERWVKALSVFIRNSWTRLTNRT
ncbi:hypothetical protein [Methylocapsa acidiphila]|uniref:hypothetical protein n=1 Tax=Methylocapsa acidiphila TaxID=133552 RepID=UPI00056802E1|nr:hypothetical protein [Methylocapsa acidiphila]